MQTERARAMRRDMTDTESRLWSKLRNHRLAGCKFRRQHPIGPYIADFACVAHRLIIELDGGHHADQAGYDEHRAKWLQSAGWRTLRFWNDDVRWHLDDVLAAITLALEEQAESVPHPAR